MNAKGELIMNAAYSYETLTEPERIEVKDSTNHLLATFTRGAYTVTLTGPTRTFTEQDASVTHTTWVRTLPSPFDGQLDTNWLAQALEANQQQVPDILTIAVQYIKGAPALLDQNGLQIAGDASYGPEKNGERQEGSDFNDYLGILWEYDVDGSDEPETKQFRCLDCSGFIRMIWGYRHSFSDYDYADTVPLSISISSDCSTIPRRAWQICIDAPGVTIISNQGVQVTNFSKLLIGYLVFFDADGNDGLLIDHVGMFLGLDSTGRHRFISSRKSIDGPTFSDFKGKSVLEGTGLYAQSFRAVRRL